MSPHADPITPVHAHAHACVHTHTHTHTGILFNHKKERSVAICNMDGLKGIMLNETSDRQTNTT